MPIDTVDLPRSLVRCVTINIVRPIARLPRVAHRKLLGPQNPHGTRYVQGLIDWLEESDPDYHVRDLNGQEPALDGGTFVCSECGVVVKRTSRRGHAALYCRPCAKRIMRRASREFWRRRKAAKEGTQA